MKKNASLLSCLLHVVGLLALVAALLMPLGSVLSQTTTIAGFSTVTDYGPAFAILFGGNIHWVNGSNSGDLALLSNSAVGLAAYILLIVGALLSIASPIICKILKKPALGKVGLCFSALLCLAGGIMALTISKEAAYLISDAINGTHIEALAQKFAETSTTGFGIIGMGIFGIVSFLFHCGALVVSFLVKPAKKAKKSAKKTSKSKK